MPQHTFSLRQAAIASLVLGPLCAAYADAQPLAAAGFQAFAGGGSPVECAEWHPFPASCEHSFSNPNGSYSERFIAFTRGGLVPEASVGGEAQGNNSTAWNQAWAQVYYNVFVQSRTPAPPVSTVPVLVRMVGAMEVKQSGVGYARACGISSVQIPGVSLLADEGTCVNTIAGPKYASYDKTEHVPFPVGLIVQTEMEAYIRLEPADVDQSGTAQAIVFVDPSFTIDPAFPYADQFTLVYSDNLGLFTDGFETGTAEHWSVPVP